MFIKHASESHGELHAYFMGFEQNASVFSYCCASPKYNMFVQLLKYGGKDGKKVEKESSGMLILAAYRGILRGKTEYICDFLYILTAVTSRFAFDDLMRDNMQKQYEKQYVKLEIHDTQRGIKRK